MSTINNSVNNKCEAGITVTGGTVNLGNDGSAVNIGTTTGSTIIIGQKTNGSGSTTIEGYSHVAGANGITLLDNEGNTLYTTVSGLYMNDSSSDSISLSGGITLDSAAAVNITSNSGGILLNADSAGIATAYVYGVTPVGGTNETVTVNSVTGQLGSTAGGGGGITTIDGDSGSVTGSTITISGGSSGAVFTGSGTTLTESFNYLELPTTTGASVGTIKINSNPVFHTYNAGGSGQNTFAGQSAGNFTLNNYAAYNTGFGYLALHGLTNGSFAAGNGASNNCAFGSESGQAITTGNDNCAFGLTNLSRLTEGVFNVSIGSQAGFQYTGTESSNILINSAGVTGESQVLRIGDGTNGYNSPVTTAYISGIAGVTTTVADAVPVLISASTSQLGTVTSSIRYKENVADMADASSGLLGLRPVTFDYIGKPNHKRQFGLIAEEVVDVMPDLVVKVNGEIETVKYQDLSVLLLNELQKALKRIEALEAKVSSYECKG